MVGRYKQILGVENKSDTASKAAIAEELPPVPIGDDPRPPWADPRSFDPDLQADSKLWEVLLRLVWEHEKRTGFEATEDTPGLYGGLWLLRCNGVRLVKDRKFGYRLVPTIDGTGDVGHESEEAYRSEARELLDPWKEELHRLLQQAGKWNLSAEKKKATGIVM